VKDTERKEHFLKDGRRKVLKFSVLNMIFMCRGWKVRSSSKAVVVEHMMMV
jgi:hypothetical protein